MFSNLNNEELIFYYKEAVEANKIYEKVVVVIAALERELSIRNGKIDETGMIELNLCDSETGKLRPQFILKTKKDQGIEKEED